MLENADGICLRDWGEKALGALARRSLAGLKPGHNIGKRKAAGLSGCCPDQAADLPAAGRLRPALQGSCLRLVMGEEIF